MTMVLIMMTTVVIVILMIHADSISNKSIGNAKGTNKHNQSIYSQLTRCWSDDADDDDVDEEDDDDEYVQPIKSLNW